jgi:hypothetical protein
MASKEETRRHAQAARDKVWERKIQLEHELAETNATLVALDRLLKEQSPKKLAALEKARRARLEEDVIQDGGGGY